MESSETDSETCLTSAQGHPLHGRNQARCLPTPHLVALVPAICIKCPPQIKFLEDCRHVLSLCPGQFSTLPLATCYLPQRGPAWVSLPSEVFPAPQPESGVPPMCSHSPPATCSGHITNQCLVPWLPSQLDCVKRKIP